MRSLWKRAVASCVGAVILLVAFPFAGFAQSFSDNFEFNPFWTLVQQNGTIAVSTAQNHTVGGQQSAKLTGTGGGQVNVWLSHTFPQAQQGTVSVWWYDTVSNNIYSGLYLFNSTGQVGSVGVFDNSPPLYVWNAGTPTYTTMPRTVGWHQLTIQGTPTALNLFIDGNTVGSASGAFSFDQVLLLVSGPGETGTFYFDDFSFTPLLGSPVPLISGRVQ
jgi:hypothetical protein